MMSSEPGTLERLLYKEELNALLTIFGVRRYTAEMIYDKRVCLDKTLTIGDI